VGVFDERRAAIATDALLRAVVEKGIRFALIDLTGVEHLDTSTAHHVTRIAQALGLLGARTIITGIRSAVARAIVELNLDLSSLETRRTLRDALRECQRSLEREPPRNTRPG
jgi:rsbT co-antagonist protein RsbR